MKLIYIANARIPTEKAHGLQIAKMCEAFVGQGLDVVLVVSRVKNSIRDNTKEYYKLKHNFKIVRVPCLPIGRLGKIGIVWQRFTFTLSAITYALFAKSDIVYTRHNYWAYFIFTLLGRKTGFEIHEPPRRLFWWHRFLLKRVQRKIIVAKKIIDLYRKWGIKKDTCIIAPNGVDANEFAQAEKNKDIWRRKFSLKPDDKIIVYVGHFYQWKGIYTLLAGAKYLDHNNQVILIGGTKQDQAKVLKYINEYEIKNVLIHDFVVHHEAIKYLKSADVLVLPNTAKEERSAKYTTPIKLFEYMASGVPIVASRLESFDAYLKDRINSVLFKPDNAQDLAKKIKLILNDNNLASSISRRAAQDVRGYTWIKRAKKIIEFINV